MKYFKLFLFSLTILLLFSECDKRTDNGNAYLIIQNDPDSGADVTEVYIRRSYTDSDWGNNKLSGSTISPNNEQTFEIEGGDQYDFKCVTTGQYDLEKDGVTFNDGRHEQWELTSSGWSSYHWYD